MKLPEEDLVQEVNVTKFTNKGLYVHQQTTCPNFFVQQEYCGEPRVGAYSNEILQ